MQTIHFHNFFENELFQSKKYIKKKSQKVTQIFCKLKKFAQSFLSFKEDI